MDPICYFSLHPCCLGNQIFLFLFFSVVIVVVFFLAPLSLLPQQPPLLPQPLVHCQWLLHKPPFNIFLVLDSLVAVVSLPSVFANIVAAVVAVVVV